MSHIGDFLPRLVARAKPPSRIKQRLIEGTADILGDEPDSILYMHSVLCQIGMPYRNPGDETRVWDRTQGKAHLRIEAGSALHPETEKFVNIGLPFGPKPRIILAHLNAEALRTKSAVIEVDRSLTAFVRRLRLPSQGTTIRLVKEQLARLSASRVLLGIKTGEGRATTVNLPKIVDAFELWFPKDERQRVLWPSTVRLSSEYFTTLSEHAVPLDERAIANLSHSAMGLDIYAWLAQRLHRVNPEKPQFIPWPAIKDQFGWNYHSLRKFRQVFRTTLAMVKTQYPRARFQLDGRGMLLANSPPPVAKRLVSVPALPEPMTPAALPAPAKPTGKRAG